MLFRREVPTVLTPTRIAFAYDRILFFAAREQIVGIPVPRGCGEQRLQGLLPGQGSTSVSSAERISERSVEQIVDIPGGGLPGFSPRQGSTAVCGAEHTNFPVPLGRGGFGDGGLHGLSQGQASTVFCEAEHVDISVPHGRGKLGDGVFSASSAGAADEGPAVRGSGMGKALFAGEVTSRALSSRGKAGLAGEDAPRGSSSCGKAGSTGYDAPRVLSSRGMAGSTRDVCLLAARQFSSSPASFSFGLTASGSPKDVAAPSWSSITRVHSTLSSGRTSRCGMMMTSTGSAPMSLCSNLLVVQDEPSEYRHAVRFSSPELARRFYVMWMGSG